MKRSSVFLRLREELLEQGRKEAEQRMKRRIIESFFNFRFDSLDSELLAIIEPILQLPLEELACLLLNASREELLDRFGE